MNKQELIDEVSNNTDLGKVISGTVIDRTLAAIAGALARGEEVRLPGFGIFAAKLKPASKAINPRNGKIVDVPTRARISFRVGRTLRGGVTLALAAKG